MKGTKRKAVVVIPVYKDMLSADERASFIQCLKVLNKYDIVLVTHLQLNCEAYNLIADEYAKPIEYSFFDEHFFEGVQGYNNLCLSADFYKTFQNYEYMLIYQLDAWVFSDQLQYWCDKDYDYIGAPWFEGFRSYEESRQFKAVGNGGFSLRRIQTMINTLTSWKPVYRECSAMRGSIINYFKGVLFLMGYHNTIRSIIKRNTWFEDIFLCIDLDNTRLQLHKPPFDEACFFAFEQSPSFLFNNKTNKTLPFGCHAFRKYEFDSFWSQYISI